VSAETGFTAIRNGILEHVEESSFCLRSYGLYMYLHQRKRWLSGVVWTNAASIATSFGEKKTTVQSLMRNLRSKGYIQYPRGFGKKGNYPVLLINDQPRHGVLKGYSLSGFTDTTCTHVYYEPLNGQHTEAVLRMCSGWGHDRLTLGGVCALVVPLLDIRQSRLWNKEEEDQDSQGGPEPESQTLEAQVKKAGA
jgi:hypothetical protein